MEPTTIETTITKQCRNLMRKKVPTGLRAEPTFAPGVLQIKHFWRETTKGTYTKEENLLARNNIAR